MFLINELDTIVQILIVVKYLQVSFRDITAKDVQNGQNTSWLKESLISQQCKTLVNPH